MSTNDIIFPNLTSAYQSAIEVALERGGAPLLLVGNSGTGKTSTILRVARSKGIDVEKFDSSMDFTDAEIRKYLEFLFSTVHEELTIILLDDLEHNILPAWLETLIVSAPRKQRRRNFRLMATSNEHWKMKREIREAFNIVKSDTRMGVHAREINKLGLEIPRHKLDEWKNNSRDLRILQQLLHDPTTEIYDRRGEYVKLQAFLKNPRDNDVPLGMYVENWLLVNALNEHENSVYDRFAYDRFETIALVVLANRMGDLNILHALSPASVNNFKKLIAPSYSR